MLRRDEVIKHTGQWPVVAWAVQCLRRREFIAGLGGAVAWPVLARAQQPPGKMRRLGVLQPGAPPDPLVEAMQGRLRELGYREGRDIAFEFRWAEGKLERLPQLATELAGLNVDVITSFSGTAALAAKKAATTIPIVFSGVGDPVGTRQDGGTSPLAVNVGVGINPRIWFGAAR
jgi:putative ABC transport system substrate-binding protein